jgi:hypothetical protein
LEKHQLLNIARKEQRKNGKNPCPPPRPKLIHSQHLFIHNKLQTITKSGQYWGIYDDPWAFVVTQEDQVKRQEAKLYVQRVVEDASKFKSR